MAMQGTRETHNTIAATLAALRRATEARARIEFLIVPTAELDRVVPAWREEGPYLDGASFDALLAEPDARLLTLSAPLGRWATSGSQGRDTLLSDYSINQTGVIPVADPVLATERSGEVLHVRLARIPGMADRLSAEVALGVYELESEAERVGDDWADLTLPRVRELLFSTTAVVPSGRPVVLGSAPGESGGVVLLRATMPVDRVRDDRPPPEARLVDAAFLGRSDESDRAWWGIEAPLDHGKWNFDPFELLSPVLTTNEVDQLRAEIWPLTGHVILVRPSAETAGRVDTFLATESKRRARTAQVEIELLSVTRETYAAMRQLAEPDSALDPKWREAVARGPDSEIRRYGIVGISGETHAVRAAEIRTLLTGGESVSGG
ncbi:MAG TPA: hypothetical protein VK116_11525, partial [Planctomycetota bacterium]|nr:hypothetical protein [Planctomycetota bacterium]